MLAMNYRQSQYYSYNGHGQPRCPSTISNQSIAIGNHSQQWYQHQCPSNVPDSSSPWSRPVILLRLNELSEHFKGHSKCAAGCWVNPIVGPQVGSWPPGIQGTEGWPDGGWLHCQEDIFLLRSWNPLAAFSYFFHNYTALNIRRCFDSWVLPKSSGRIIILLGSKKKKTKTAPQVGHVCCGFPRRG